ncbi:hypothetical protein IT774_07520 [Salinimonas marina]|uniref:Uncharacterized protein n=1 Tax=Salinimonas marina TaxID=2785918 RepID=A0A7S9DZR7_9ALTE|nr:hypothetical protein [Salinimonas marina]QPG06943.1 hypothetical protein IT774_07520 [Salinimonas marina]
MTKVYAVYSKTIPSPQRDTMLAAYPSAAQYGEHYLFPMSHEQLTGEAHPTCVDLSASVLVESDPQEGQQTYKDFDALYDSTRPVDTTREVIVSVQQGRYLKESRYSTDAPPTE